jgi:hypothetical protein
VTVVSWLPHMLVPALFALAFLTRLPRRWVIAFAPIVWVPDLDYVSNMMGLPGHRVLTHNAWIPAAFLLAAALWVRSGRASQGGGRSLYEPGWGLALLLIAYYWASHVFLDVFAGGALLLWPLSTLNFYLFYEIHIDLSTGGIEPVAEGGTEPGPPDLSADYTWLSFEHTATLAFLAVAGFAWLVWRAWGRRKGRLRPTASNNP